MQLKNIRSEPANLSNKDKSPSFIEGAEPLKAK
ncbi:hypothetical protein P700755_002222 [Psychroflexus torquis ATCC 700755]|uniref:Uncharacterized protein n=1 Tax=Psychroflexus torquis (strain ATCC 700755 / CIP 106069 / ACAM 623) TaxID=313595 RepID=K4IEQ2_PSYTT|nr:hypothetical protein P700755_002222 [Psychroflexus torquis ATCC 700755]